MVSTRRQAQEDPPAPATKPKAQPARAGRRKAAPKEESDAPPASVTAPPKKPAVPKKATATRARATRSKAEPEVDKQEEHIEEEAEEPQMAAPPKRATRTKTAAIQTTKEKKVTKVEEPTATVAKRATRTRATKKEKEDLASEKKVTENAESELPPEPKSRPTRATKASTAKNKNAVKTTKAKAKSAVKASTKATRATRSKKTEPAPAVEEQAEEDHADELAEAAVEEDNKEEPERESNDLKVSEEDELALDDPFFPKPQREPAVIKIDMALTRPLQQSPSKASPTKSIMRAVSEAPTTSALFASPSKLPRPQDIDELAMEDKFFAPTPVHNASTFTAFGRTPMMKSSLFSASARKGPPGSALRMHPLSPSQSLVRPSGHSTSETQKLASSLFSTSPKKMAIESSLLAAAPKSKSSTEGKLSALTASPRKLKLESPAVKFRAGSRDMSASVSKPFGKSSLLESPRRLKTPGRAPATAPISSIRAFLDAGTPIRPPKFNLQRTEAIIESNEADDTIMFEEPDFPCITEAPQDHPTPVECEEDDVFAPTSVYVDDENMENEPETPIQEPEVVPLTLGVNGLNELATPALDPTSRQWNIEHHDEEMVSPSLPQEPNSSENVSQQSEDLAVLSQAAKQDYFSMEPSVKETECSLTPTASPEDLQRPATPTEQYVVQVESPEAPTTPPTPKPREEQEEVATTPPTPETQHERIATTPPTPKAQEGILLPMTRLERPILSPRKSSLKSPEKKSLESPRKTVTWEQLQEAATPRVKQDGILSGTVFYVDVRGSDGTDAANLFAPLLEDLGALCVPQWSSNSMGVTHVLFKDGDKRTLEKVVASNGIVKCVNIGWALDCEKTGKRVDESQYLIKLNGVSGSSPTKALSTLDANSSPLAARTPARTPISSPFKMISPFKAAPTPFTFKPIPPSPQLSFEGPDKENSPAATVSGASPTTPYFLHEELIQRTCPPKQSHQPLFSSFGATSSFSQKLAQVKRRQSEYLVGERTPKRSRPELRDIFE